MDVRLAHLDAPAGLGRARQREHVGATQHVVELAQVAGPAAARQQVGRLGAQHHLAGLGRLEREPTELEPGLGTIDLAAEPEHTDEQHEESDDEEELLVLASRRGSLPEVVGDAVRFGATVVLEDEEGEENEEFVEDRPVTLPVEDRIDLHPFEPRDIPEPKVAITPIPSVQI